MYEIYTLPQTVDKVALEFTFQSNFFYETNFV